MTSLVLVKITLHVIWCYTISWTLSTGFEEDPEASGLLIPNFLNEYHVVDEEEELYGVKWGKEVYLQNFPKLDRPSEKWETSFIHDVMYTHTTEIVCSLATLWETTVVYLSIVASVTIMEKYKLKYDDAVRVYIRRILPKLNEELLW